VLVADASSATRSALRRGLETETAGCTVCAEASDAPETVDTALRERPDVCLIDPVLPGGGIDAAAAIVGELPDTAVVMLGDAPSDAELFAALEAGASGYLPKGIAPERLAVALHRLRAGEAALSRMLVTRLVAEFRRRRSPQLRCLTSRELEVLELLCQGLRTAEIAARLFVARVTVRTHIAAILRKLDVPDREAAIRLLDER
jgi:two-component system nitrate/nitrite response regulator NarL